MSSESQRISSDERTERAPRPHLLGGVQKGRRGKSALPFARLPMQLCGRYQQLAEGRVDRVGLPSEPSSPSQLWHKVLRLIPRHDRLSQHLVAIGIKLPVLAWAGDGPLPRADGCELGAAVPEIEERTQPNLGLTLRNSRYSPSRIVTKPWQEIWRVNISNSSLVSLMAGEDDVWTVYVIT